MTWIKTLPPTENEAVHEALGGLVELYPQEYAPERRAEGMEKNAGASPWPYIFPEIPIC